MLGLPFIGPAGRELDLQLQATGILRYECIITNVFDSRPKDNNIEAFCVSRAEAGKDYQLPALSAGKYVRPEIAYPALARLREELSSFPSPPNLILTLGNTALWALAGISGIKSVRGTVVPGRLLPTKVLPTYHPAAVLRDFSLRPIVLADLLKAKLEQDFPEIRRPARTVYVAETPEDIASFDFDTDLLAFDVETKPKARLLDCVGLAPSADRALVIPFLSKQSPDLSYWKDAKTEAQVWRLLKKILESSIPKVAQNGIYDYQWLRAYGIRVRNWSCDTMIAHHALYPELPKSLDFLGSIYTNEMAWKLLRPRGAKTGKREE